MTIRSLITFVSLVLATWISTTRADAIAIGDKVRGPFKIQEKQIPLPAGEWIVAGTGKQTAPLPPAIGAFGVVETFVLVKLAGKDIMAVAEINANAIPVTDGWGQTESCKKGDQFLMVTRYKTGWDLACFFINTTPLAKTIGPDAWMAAQDYLAKQNIALPKTALTTGFRTSDRQDIVDLRLHFNPAYFPGLTTADLASPWTADGIKQNPRQLRIIEMLSAWALGIDGWIERGIANKLSASQPIEDPVRAAVLSDTPLIDRKLVELEQLYDRRFIDAASLSTQEKQALSERPLVIEQSGGIPLSLKKNISFRVFGSIVDYILAYTVTLNSATSAGITASIIGIHSVIFVINDMFWDDYFAKQTTRDANRLVDFSYIGKPTS